MTHICNTLFEMVIYIINSLFLFQDLMANGYFGSEMYPIQFEPADESSQRQDDDVTVRQRHVRHRSKLIGLVMPIGLKPRNIKATTINYSTMHFHVLSHIWLHFPPGPLFRRGVGEKFENFHLRSSITLCYIAMALISMVSLQKFLMESTIQYL